MTRKARIAHLAGPNATIQNTPPLMGYLPRDAPLPNTREAAMMVFPLSGNSS